MYRPEDLKRWIEDAESELSALDKRRKKAIAEYRRAEAKVNHLRGLLSVESRQPLPAEDLGSEDRADSSAPRARSGSAPLRPFVRAPRNIIPELRRAARTILIKTGPLAFEDLYSRLPAQIRLAMERSTSSSPPVDRMVRYLGMAPDFAVHARINQITLVGSFEDELNNWFLESRERFEEKRNHETQQPKHGLWSVSYSINGQFKAPTLSELRDILRNVQLPYTGWAVWYVPMSGSLPIYPTGNSLECWLDDEWDFWRVSRFGLTYMIRPFQEDFLFQDSAPGKEFDLTIPIWRIGECLMHAKKLSDTLVGKTATIIFKARWEGLSGRKIVTRANPNQMLHGDHVATGDLAESMLSVESVKIEAELSELVRRLTEPLYTTFNFLKPPEAVFEQELQSMFHSRVG